MKTTSFAARLLPATVVAFSALTLGLLSISPLPSYGTSVEEAASKGAQAGAAAGKKAAQDESPEEEDTGKEEGGCCG